MNSLDSQRLRAIEDEDLALETARKERRTRTTRRVGAAGCGLLLVAFGASIVWAFWAKGQKSRDLVLVGRTDAAVRVEIEGEPPIEVPRRGGRILSLAHPGPHRFRFVEVETGESFERVLDVPGREEALDEGRLVVVPTQEGMCFAMVDLSSWYGEAQSVLEVASELRERAERERAEGAPPPAAAPLPAPQLVARLRPLDVLPYRGYTRNFHMHEVLPEGASTMTLVDVPCEDLSSPDDEFVSRLLTRRLGTGR